jgi:hypothetical protein
MMTAARADEKRDACLTRRTRASIRFMASKKRDEIYVPKSGVERGLVDKLGVKPGARVAMVALEDDALAAGMAAVGANVHEGAPRGEVDLILFGVSAERDLTRVAALAKKLAKTGALWTVRPKGKGGVAEGAVFAAGLAAGLVDVKVVRFSETHTANKFVIPLAKR